MPQGNEEAEQRLLQDQDMSYDHVLNHRLPPTDRGSAAWRFLAGVCILEGAIWGYTLSFGIIQTHIAQNPLFRDSSHLLPVIGTTQTAFAYFGFPLVTSLYRTHPQHGLSILWTGWSFCIAGLLVASFATHVWHLVLTEGVLLGAGWALCYTPFLAFTNQWFIRRRGMVYGIMFGTAGLVSLFLPFLLEAMLRRGGFRATMRSYAGLVVVVTGPTNLLIRPRVREVRERVPEQTLDEKSVCNPDCSPQRIQDAMRPLLRNKTFVATTLAVFLQGLVFFLPRFYLPPFAYDLGLSHEQGALILSCIGLAQVFGQPGMGYLSDHIHIHVPTTLSTGVCACASLLLWAPAKDVKGLVAFALLWGCFGGGFNVLWTRWTTYLTEDEGTNMAMYSVFSMARGMGDVLGGPTASMLEGSEVDLRALGLSKYRAIIFFIGLSMLLSSLNALSFIWDGDVRVRKSLEMGQSGHFNPMTNEHAETPQELDPFVRGPESDGEST